MKILNIVTITLSILFLDGNATHFAIGQEWTEITNSAGFCPRSDHQLVAFDGKIWLIGGRKQNGEPTGDIWYSKDAVNWNLASGELPVEGGNAVIFQDKIWLINCNGRSVWNSQDGIHWDKVSAIEKAPEFGTRAVVFKGKIWMSGGADVYNTYLPDGTLNPNREIVWKNCVFSSSDGINWKEESTNSCFSVRSDHSMIVYDDKVWIIFGQSGPNKNDVWNSTDGVTWNLVSTAPFRARHVSETIIFRNKIWVFGGFAFNDSNHPVLLDDVWNTSDGILWKEVSHSAPFGRRMEHRVTVFNGRIFLIGGMCGTFPDQLAKNDIWIME